MANKLKIKGIKIGKNIFKPRSEYYVLLHKLNKVSKPNYIKNSIKKLKRWHVGSRLINAFINYNNYLGSNAIITPEYIRAYARKFKSIGAIKFLTNKIDIMKKRYKAEYAAVTETQISQFLWGVQANTGWNNLTPIDKQIVAALINSTHGKNQLKFQEMKMLIYEIFGIEPQR